MFVLEIRPQTQKFLVSSHRLPDAVLGAFAPVAFFFCLTSHSSSWLLSWASLLR